MQVINIEETGKKLKKMFKERGLTAKYIQQQLELESVQSVYKWISPNCKTLPSIDNLVLLAMLMDCQLDDILVLEDINS